jgi:hypothetical protein
MEASQINIASLAAYSKESGLGRPFSIIVTSTCIADFAKATTMQFLENLIAWGDSLCSVYTMENVSQTEQLYIIAGLILCLRARPLIIADRDRNCFHRNCLFGPFESVSGDTRLGNSA